MSISRIASGYAQTTSANLSATPSVGDRIVDFAHRDGTNTAPSLASGFANIENGGSNTNGLRASSKASAGTETSTGTCANATSVGGVAYRGLDPQVPFGAIDQTGGTGTSLTFPSLTLQVGDGSSWVAACGAHRTATNVNANAPSLTLVGSGVADLGVSDSNGGVSSYAGGSQTVNASSGWRTAVVELVAQQSTAVPSQLVQSSATYSNLDTETGNDFICQLHAASGANNSIVVFVNYEAPAGGVTRALTISGIGGSVTATAVAGPVTGNGVITAGYLIEGIASGVTALKFHFTDNGSPVQVNSFHATYGEYSGVATSSALRAANANASAGGGAGPTLALQPGNLSVTAGDVVVVFALSNGWGPSLRGATVTGWRAAPGYHLLHADRDIGIATMVGVASATGTINPAIYCADSATDTFACLAIVLKGSPGSGTPGAATRILTSTHTYFAQAGTALVSAPINGDAQVILGAHGNGLVAITSANGSGVGTYAVNAPTGNRPQCIYAAGLTQDSTNVATLALSPTNAGWQCVIYDLVGIDPTTPFDQVASASSTGSFTGPGDINTGSVTPTNAGAVVLTALRVTGGPIDSMSGPAGVVYDAPYYTGQTDSSVMDLGEGYAHVTNAPASSLTFLWHSASTPDWDWSAFVFNAAAGGGTDHPATSTVSETSAGAAALKADAHLSATVAEATTGASGLKSDAGLAATASESSSGGVAAQLDAQLRSAEGEASSGSLSVSNDAALAATSGEASAGAAALTSDATLAATAAELSAGSATLASVAPISATIGEDSAGSVAITADAAAGATNAEISTGAITLELEDVVGPSATVSESSAGALTLHADAALGATASELSAGAVGLTALSPFSAGVAETSAGAGGVILDATLAATVSEASSGALALASVAPLSVVAQESSSGSVGLELEDVTGLSATVPELSSGSFTPHADAALAAGFAEGSAGGAGITALSPLASTVSEVSAGTAALNADARASATAAEASAGAVALSSIAGLAASVAESSHGDVGLDLVSGLAGTLGETSAGAAGITAEAHFSAAAAEVSSGTAGVVSDVGVTAGLPESSVSALRLVDDFPAFWTAPETSSSTCVLELDDASPPFSPSPPPSTAPRTDLRDALGKAPPTRLAA